MAYDSDVTSVVRGNPHILTLATPIVHDGGTISYEDVTDKPTINGVELSGDITLYELGLPDGPLTSDDVDEIIDSLE